MNDPNPFVRAREAAESDDEAGQRVVVTNVQMPFWSMVVFMVKWVIASIPAFIILALLGFVATLLFAGVFGGLGEILGGQ